jgi:large conductance mechanosensitive channel
MFIQSVVDFIIIAFCIFIVVKVMNKALPKKKEEPSAGPTELEVLTEIRDLLKKSPKA